MAYAPHAGPAPKRLTPSESSSISANIRLARPMTIKQAHLSTHFDLSGDCPTTYSDRLGKTRFAVIEKDSTNGETIIAPPVLVQPAETYIVERPRPSSSFSNPRGQMHMKSNEVNGAAFKFENNSASSTTIDNLRLDAEGHAIRKRAASSRAANAHFHGSTVDTSSLPESEVIHQQQRRHVSGNHSLYKTTFVLE